MPISGGYLTARCRSVAGNSCLPQTSAALGIVSIGRRTSYSGASAAFGLRHVRVELNRTHPGTPELIEHFIGLLVNEHAQVGAERHCPLPWGPPPERGRPSSSRTMLIRLVASSGRSIWVASMIPMNCMAFTPPISTRVLVTSSMLWPGVRGQTRSSCSMRSKRPGLEFLTKWDTRPCLAIPPVAYRFVRAPIGDRYSMLECRRVFSFLVF